MVPPSPESPMTCWFPSCASGRLAALLLVPLAGLLAAQGRETAAAGPVVKLSADRLEFGSVKAGATVSGEIKIENVGDAPLHVTRVGVTCECAHLHISTPTRLNVPIDRADEGRTDLALAPGEAATLKLTVDTAKLAAGPFEKRCLILCSDRARSPLSVPFALTIERPAPPSPAREERDEAGMKQDGTKAGEEDPEGRDGSGRSEATDPLAEPLSSPGPPPRIECDSYKADFGEIYRGERVFHTFTIRNRGSGDLVLKEIRSTCSCAVAKLTIGDLVLREEDLKERNEKRWIGAVRPGLEAQLEVELRSAKTTLPGKDVHLNKQIRIVSNDPARPSLPLTLEATMMSPFEIEPEKFDFGRVKKGAGATLSAVMYSDRLGAFEVRPAPSPYDKFLRVTVTRVPVEATLPPTWRVEATVDPSAPLGNFNSHVDLAIDHPRVSELVLPVFLTVEPNVSFTGNRPEGGEFLDFETMNGAEDKTVELRIENGDAAVPYAPTQVTVEARPLSDAFRTELVEIEKGMKYLLRLTAPKELSKSRFFQGDVVLTADHPDLPVKKIRFRGWFRTVTK